MTTRLAAFRTESRPLGMHWTDTSKLLTGNKAELFMGTHDRTIALWRRSMWPRPQHDRCSTCAQTAGAHNPTVYVVISNEHEQT
eukprot:scaffold77133_cov39-Prasinocladus_malaysianus.AAC.1